jgi:negative regulator of genetic competence, sporulation and motility
MFNHSHSSFSLQDEENVEDLEKLKTHAESSSDEKLEESLKKLHDSNSHHKHSEEKPTKVKYIKAVAQLKALLIYFEAAIPRRCSIGIRSKR